ncbi:MAG: LCP family protein [Oscillospiraceae bacterium]|nr:LCP family protein [Oscillospiraceae bacterium]
MKKEKTKKEKLREKVPLAKAAVRRRLRTVILALVLVAAVAGTAAVVYVYPKLQKITQNDGFFFPDETVPDEDEVTGLEVGYDNVNASSLDEYLTLWATNDIKKLSDKNVLNVLLCGVDTKNGKAVGGRSDAMLLVSVNKKKKVITVTSFFRDSYSYIDLRKSAKNPRVMLDKVNSAYSLGGPATLIETLEANYKIEIDAYVSVDFQSFPKLIDALGGVKVDVPQAEASYINRTAPSMKRKFPAGSGVTLTGAQALVYSRIRHLDSDINRTARQRKVILAILQSARNATSGQINNALDQTLGYVVTNLTKMEITSIATSAISQGWLKFPVIQNNSPTLESENATGVSTYIRGKFVWVVDYPRAAHDLQLQLYGVSNIAFIVDEEQRSDYLAQLFRDAARQSGGGSAGGSGSKTTAPPSSVVSSSTEAGSVTSEASTETPDTTAKSYPWWWPQQPTDATEPETEEETEASTQTTEPTATTTGSSTTAQQP